jgi:glycosyltransferase involved in cell wall biosynthesis
MTPPQLSAIVLCYRAEESILKVIEPLREDLLRSGVPFELVLVANSDRDAPDTTPAIVEKFAATLDNVVTVRKEKEGAMGWDMRSGLEAGTGEYLIVIDGDAQNPVEDVLRMYREMVQSGADLMKGRRTNRLDGLYRRVISWVYNALFVLLFGTRGLWDVNGKPKGLKRSAYEQMELTSDDWFVDAEMVLAARRAGMRIAEMPVVFRTNEERSSFVRVSSILEFLRNMVRARTRGR